MPIPVLAIGRKALNVFAAPATLATKYFAPEFTREA
jgi:hypothetical protein